MKRDSRNINAYTLIEALIASSVLLIGIAAAASMSLAMVTQEEMTERANKSFNYVDNAVLLLQLGLDPDTIQNQILPPEDTITGITIEPHNVNVPGLGNRNRWWIEFAYNTTNSKSSSVVTDGWTGGLKDTSRTHAFYVYRSKHFLDGDLPRVSWVKANP